MMTIDVKSHLSQKKENSFEQREKSKSLKNIQQRKKNTDNVQQRRRSRKIEGGMSQDKAKLSH